VKNIKDEELLSNISNMLISNHGMRVSNLLGKKNQK